MDGITSLLVDFLWWACRREEWPLNTSKLCQSLRSLKGTEKDNCHVEGGAGAGDPEKQEILVREYL